MSAETVIEPPRDSDGPGAGLQSLMRMFHVLFLGLRVLIIVIFVWMVFSGVFRVEDGKEALLFRFGRLQEMVLDSARGPTAVLTSGHWYWAWPYPVDYVKKIPAQQALSVSTDTVFWPRVNPNQIQTPDPATMENLPLVPGQDGYVLTGDTNIMHAVWSLTYRVRDAKRYYLAFYDDSEDPPGPDGKPLPPKGHAAVLRNLLANAALAEISTWSVEDMLRSSRVSPSDPEVKELLTDNVRKRVEQKLAVLDMGIDAQLVNLVDIQPPTATLTAFRKVGDAATEQRQIVEAAGKYAAQVLPAAEGEAYRVLDEARAYRTRSVESVQAESAYFRTVLSEYRKNPHTMLVALYSDAIRDVLKRVETKYVIRAAESGRQELRLQLGPQPVKWGSRAAGDGAPPPEAQR
jgi:regulator of protease activity HflC (stomatin/prohibitin superfamily)